MKRPILRQSQIPEPKWGGRVCRICFVEKSSFEFASDKSRPSGRHPYCKECVHKQKSSPQALAKRRMRMKWTTKEAKQYHKEYHQRPEVKERTRERARKYREDNPQKERVRGALKRAVYRGDIKRPRACARCATVGRVEAHHYLGYDWENRFRVSWVCRSCHAYIHKTGDIRIAA